MYCHSPADREPSQTSNILVSFELSPCLMVSCQHCGYFASHFQGFTQHSNNVSTDTALHIQEVASIHFLFVTRLSFQLLWLSPCKITFLFEPSTTRERISSHFHIKGYFCLILCILFCLCFFLLLYLIVSTYILSPWQTLHLVS